MGHFRDLVVVILAILIIVEAGDSESIFTDSRDASDDSWEAFFPSNSSSEPSSLEGIANTLVESMSDAYSASEKHNSAEASPSTSESANGTATGSISSTGGATEKTNNTGSETGPTSSSSANKTTDISGTPVTEHSRANKSTTSTILKPNEETLNHTTESTKEIQVPRLSNVSVTPVIANSTNRKSSTDLSNAHKATTSLAESNSTTQNPPSVLNATKVASNSSTVELSTGTLFPNETSSASSSSTNSSLQLPASPLANVTDSIPSVRNLTSQTQPSALSTTETVPNLTSTELLSKTPSLYDSTASTFSSTVSPLSPLINVTNSTTSGSNSSSQSSLPAATMTNTHNSSNVELATKSTVALHRSAASNFSLSSVNLSTELPPVTNVTESIVPTISPSNSTLSVISNKTTIEEVEVISTASPVSSTTLKSTLATMEKPSVTEKSISTDTSSLSTPLPSSPRVTNVSLIVSTTPETIASSTITIEETNKTTTPESTNLIGNATLEVVPTSTTTATTSEVPVTTNGSMMSSTSGELSDHTESHSNATEILSVSTVAPSSAARDATTAAPTASTMLKTTNGSVTISTSGEPSDHTESHLNTTDILNVSTAAPSPAAGDATTGTANASVVPVTTNGSVTSSTTDEPSDHSKSHSNTPESSNTSTTTESSNNISSTAHPLPSNDAVLHGSNISASTESSAEANNGNKSKGSNVWKWIKSLLPKRVKNKEVPETKNPTSAMPPMNNGTVRIAENLTSTTAPTENETTAATMSSPTSTISDISSSMPSSTESTIHLTPNFTATTISTVTDSRKATDETTTEAANSTLNVESTTEGFIAAPLKEVGINSTIVIPRNLTALNNFTTDIGNATVHFTALSARELGSNSTTAISINSRTATNNFSKNIENATENSTPASTGESRSNSTIVTLKNLTGSSTPAPIRESGSNLTVTTPSSTTIKSTINIESSTENSTPASTRKLGSNTSVIIPTNSTRSLTNSTINIRNTTASSTPTSTTESGSSSTITIPISSSLSTIKSTTNIESSTENSTPASTTQLGNNSTITIPASLTRTSTNSTINIENSTENSTAASTTELDSSSTTTIPINSSSSTIKSINNIENSTENSTPASTRKSGSSSTTTIPISSSSSTIKSTINIESSTENSTAAFTSELDSSSTITIPSNSTKSTTNFTNNIEKTTKNSPPASTKPSGSNSTIATPTNSTTMPTNSTINIKAATEDASTLKLGTITTTTQPASNIDYQSKSLPHLPTPAIASLSNSTNYFASTLSQGPKSTDLIPSLDVAGSLSSTSTSQQSYPETSIPTTLPPNYTLPLTTALPPSTKVSLSDVTHTLTSTIATNTKPKEPNATLLDDSTESTAPTTTPSTIEPHNTTSNSTSSTKLAANAIDPVATLVPASRTAKAFSTPTTNSTSAISSNVTMKISSTTESTTLSHEMLNATLPATSSTVAPSNLTEEIDRNFTVNVTSTTQTSTVPTTLANNSRPMVTTNTTQSPSLVLKTTVGDDETTTEHQTPNTTEPSISKVTRVEVSSSSSSASMKPTTSSEDTMTLPISGPTSDLLNVTLITESTSPISRDTTSSSSTSSATEILTNSLPMAEVKISNFSYVVTNKTTEVPCMLLNMSISLKMSYRRTDQTVGNGTLVVPENASTDGTCSQNNSQVILTWNSTNGRRGDSTSNNTLFLNFVKNGSMSSLDSIVFQIHLDQVAFPGTAESKLSGRTTTGLGLFSSTVNRGHYLCNSVTDVEADGVSISIRNVSLIAFNEDKDLGSKQEENCDAAASANMAIVIGIVVGGLLVFAAIAIYMSRRGNNSYDNSMLP